MLVNPEHVEAIAPDLGGAAIRLTSGRVVRVRGAPADVALRFVVSEETGPRPVVLAMPKGR